MALPTLTPEQREAALAKAAEARQVVTAALQELKAGKITLGDILDSESDTIRKVKVVRVLKAIKGVGPTAVAKAFTDIGIADGRRVAGLSERQRDELIKRFTPTVKP